MKNNDFTKGSILPRLLKFMLPVLFSMFLQALCGAFIVRIPFALLMEKIGEGSLFAIGLSIPLSTVLQIIMCFAAYFYFNRKRASNS